jgi:hypothetical protein
MVMRRRREASRMTCAYVASIGDLARMSAALGRDQDLEPLRQLRILAELEFSLEPDIEI